MEFVKVMEKALEMCNDFTDCSDCPIYYSPTPFTCWRTLFTEPEKAEKSINEYIFARDYLRRKEHATE